MTNKKIACHTLGCKVNQYDTQAMLELFINDGFTAASISDECDVYIINTCTVTHTGDTKSIKLIRRLRREHNKSFIIAAGCLTQREPKLVLDAGADMAIGVQYRAQVVDLYKQALISGEKLDKTATLKDAPFEELRVTGHEGKTRAVMKIQEGCDRFCSYCIIPYVRGPVRSMPLKNVVIEAQRLVDAGYKELIVTGIHLNSYGREENITLLDAIKAISQVPGVLRIRLGSIEPVTVTDEFARVIASLNNVMPQFHLSMQSGSETVLKRMHRRYTPSEYLAAVNTLRKYMPNCAITTDVIAGFPGETEDEFNETVCFIKTVGFARIHAFPYSRRSGTVADRLPGQVDEETKKQRTLKLIDVGNKLEEEYVKSHVGTYQQVLFETCDNLGLCRGFTGSYVTVLSNVLPGTLATVKITGVKGTELIGEPISN